MGKDRSEFTREITDIAFAQWQACAEFMGLDPDDQVIKANYMARWIESFQHSMDWPGWRGTHGQS